MNRNEGVAAAVAEVRGLIKFIYSEKVTKFCEISTVDLSYVKSKVEISQNFVAFSEYMNFNSQHKKQKEIINDLFKVFSSKAIYSEESHMVNMYSFSFFY